MEHFLSIIALGLILISTGGFIIFIIKQKREIFRLSYRVLIASFVFHTISLGYQYYTLGTAPVLSLKASLSFFSWSIIGVYLICHQRFGLMVLGSFIAPFASILMIVSTSIPSAEIVVKPMLKSFWLPVHVVTIFAGDGMFVVTFIAAIMYLIQENQIKYKKRGPFYSRLPSLVTLDSINHYSLIWGFSLITIGMLTGTLYAQYALGSYWRWDPKEVWSLITWLSYAVLLHERLAVGWRGRKAAIMSLFCFLILVFTFIGGSIWLSEYHSFKNLTG